MYKEKGSEHAHLDEIRECHVVTYLKEGALGGMDCLRVLRAVLSMFTGMCSRISAIAVHDVYS